MEQGTLTVDVEIDAEIFRNFAVFDTFRRQRRWVLPAVFAGIMLSFSAVVFVLRDRAGHAGLLGGVLLAVGVLLPAVYFFSYLHSVRGQIKKLGLSRPRYVYTLRFRGGGIEVNTEKENAFYAWDKVYGAYRTVSCTYLFFSPQRAFLLPDARIEGGGDTLWELLNRALPAERLHDCRAGKYR